MSKEYARRIAEEGTVVVVFHATWCPFCQRFMPEWREHVKSAELATVEADISHPKDEAWDTYGIETIPTVVAYAGGKETARLEAAPGVGLDAKALDGFLRGLDST